MWPTALKIFLVYIIFPLACGRAKSFQSCLTPYDPIDRSLPGSPNASDAASILETTPSKDPTGLWCQVSLVA